MARSDLMKFWKLLADAKFTGRPSLLTEVELWGMGMRAGLLKDDLEAVLRGLREFLKGREKE